MTSNSKKNAPIQANPTSQAAQLGWFHPSDRYAQTAKLEGITCAGEDTVTPKSWLNLLYRTHPIRTLVGQVEEIEMGLIGQIRLTLKTSLGSVILITNRDRLPETLEVGAWIEANLILSRLGTEPGRLFNGRLLSEQAVLLARQDSESEGFPSCWVPAETSDNRARLQDLQRILTTLEPGLQTFFMLVFTQGRMQRQFFNRIGATDHHVYSGGLLNASVKAAQSLMKQSELTDHERGLGAIACLLFDLAKVLEDTFRPDLGGQTPSVEPHDKTLECVRKPLQLLESLDSSLAHELHALLSPRGINKSKQETGSALTLKDRVHQAIWKSRKSGEVRQIDLDASSDPSDNFSRAKDEKKGDTVLFGNNTSTFDKNQIAKLAWAAGFADGEACVYIFCQRYREPRRKPSFRLGFSITQNDRTTLEFFKHVLNIPCSIYLVKRQRYHSKQVFTLNMTGVAAIDALQQLQPYLIRKKGEVELAMSYWKFSEELKTMGRGRKCPGEMETRERFFLEMKRLK